MLEKHIITSAWDDGIPDGIRFHVADIYLEELDHVDTEVSVLSVRWVFSKCYWNIDFTWLFYL